MFSFFKKFDKRDSSEIIDKDTLEERLLECDVEYEIIENMLETLGKNVKRADLEAKLRAILGEAKPLREICIKPLVHLIIGVNGAGKTTTIAKLARIYKNDGKRVILGAGDTFRAAAVEQLCAWGVRLDIECVKSKFGADPSAVAYDTISAAKARGCDIALIDTAGRLENKANLRNELVKIAKVCGKALETSASRLPLTDSPNFGRSQTTSLASRPKLGENSQIKPQNLGSLESSNSRESLDLGDSPESPFHKILILDGTQGSQAIAQAKAFHEILDLDGIIITKLDGTSKGGCIVSITKSLKLPILFVGTGEGAEDLMSFEKEWYVKNLLDYVYGG